MSTEITEGVLPPGSFGSTIFSDCSLAFRRDPLGFVQHKTKQYGPVFLCRLLNQPTIVVTSHSLASQVLEGPDASHFSLPAGYSMFLDGIFGDQIMGASGTEHERLQKELHQLLGPSAINQGKFVKKIDSTVDELRVFILDSIGHEEKQRDLYAFLKASMTRVCLSLFLGVKMDDVELVDQLTKLTTAHWHGIISLPVKLRIPGLSFLQTKRSAAVAAAGSLRELIENSYDSSPASKEDGGDDNNESVLDAIKGIMHRDEAVEHTLLFISALIPKAMAALLTQAMLAMSDGNPGSLRHKAALDSLYLENVLEEVERCFPPFFGCRRVVTKTVTMDGVKFPAGHHVLVVTPLANRDEDTFKNGEHFIPERWSAPVDNKSKPITYGAGPRSCIGQYLMRPLLKSISSMLLKNFDWSVNAPSRDSIGDLKWLPISRPVHSVETTLRPLQT